MEEEQSFKLAKLNECGLTYGDSGDMSIDLTD